MYAYIRLLKLMINDPRDPLNDWSRDPWPRNLIHWTSVNLRCVQFLVTRSIVMQCEHLGKLIVFFVATYSWYNIFVTAQTALYHCTIASYHCTFCVSLHSILCPELKRTRNLIYIGICYLSILKFNQSINVSFNNKRTEWPFTVLCRQ